ncbi:hypothetical protein GIB67_042016 [Kingdonia uniflora]|uniref:SET domain-containing protein n=1 Tax=Kingdonia uniflora TaxID=39325 RepID=A0A7J7P020_9MAGN|nr:hypothetical protein GIB67_042016 [Kingdonia uniflora]
MEKLKSMIPTSIQRMISASTVEDLPSTCSSLVDFFLSLDHFHNVVKQLSDPEMALCRKDTVAAMDLKRKGNECFSGGDYAKALSFYSQALRFAPMNDDNDENRKLVATLYANRAFSLHKLGLLVECIRDCDRAVILSPCYAKAWYKRGRANASLQNYEDAMHDLNVAMNMELSLGGKNRIKDELEIISNHCQGTSGILYKCEEKKLGPFDGSVVNNKGSWGTIIRDHSLLVFGDAARSYESNLVTMLESYMAVESHVSHQIKLQCVSTPAKGRGMASLSDIPRATLIHTEEPYAAVVLKHCRETHCHFCLNVLPADTVPCPSCTIPLYCSQSCEGKAGGQRSWSRTNNNSINGSSSANIEGPNASTTRFGSNSESSVTDSNLEGVSEHRHECGGAHWAAILPSEIVLAGRVLAKSIERRRHSAVKPTEALDFSQNYARMSSDSKLEAHIYSSVLTYCLQQSYGAEFPLTEASVSKLVVLISQIKVNSMAVVHIKSQETYALQQTGKLSLTDDFSTNNIEQVISLSRWQYTLGLLQDAGMIGCHHFISRRPQPSPSYLDVYRILKYLKLCSGLTLAYSARLQPYLVSHSSASVEYRAIAQGTYKVRVGQAIYSIGSMLNHSCQPNINAYFLSRRLLIRSTEFVAAGYPLEISYGPQVGQWDVNKRHNLLEEQYSFNCQCTGCSEINLSDLVINAFSCPKAKCSGVVLGSRNLEHGKQEGSSSRSVPLICRLERPLPDDKLQRDEINEVAHILLHPSDGTHRAYPGHCLNCGSYSDLESSWTESTKSWSYVKRLTDAIISREVSIDILSNALKALNVLRSTMHAYNKDIALVCGISFQSFKVENTKSGESKLVPDWVEDNLAEAFCLIGDFQRALQHCKASIEILGKLYHEKHIVIANELVKLSSIQLSLGDRASAVENINRLKEIFSLYYGSHAAKIVPFLGSLHA